MAVAAWILELEKNKIIGKDLRLISTTYIKIINLAQKLRPWQTTKLRSSKKHLAELTETHFPCLESSILINIDQNWAIKVSACS